MLKKMMGEDYATPQFFSGQLLDGQSLLSMDQIYESN